MQPIFAPVTLRHVSRVSTVPHSLTYRIIFFSDIVVTGYQMKCTVTLSQIHTSQDLNNLIKSNFNAKMLHIIFFN